ncbi:MAG: hypothetical protein KGL39_12235 [Patescibacteria group bacterium]|nr:hypothetical protein [Patescibacteria group bacterium]
MKYRFYFNVVAGISLAIQQSAARPYGWYEGHPYTYIEKKGTYPKERDKAIGDCRDGQGVWCYSFVCLVPKQKFLPAVRKLLKEHVTFAFEGKTHWSTKGKQEADIIEHSMGYWKVGKLNHRQAVEFGSKGGKVSVRTRRASENYMPVVPARAIWRDPKFPTWREALAEINADGRYNPIGSLSTANRYLKKRKLPPGPRGPRAET